MSKYLTVLRICARYLIYSTVTVLIIAAFGLVYVHVQGQKLLSVQTASMSPVFKPGDAVLVENTKTSKLHVGDIISYVSPKDQNLVITHRIINIDARTKWLTTSGDALHTRDPVFPPRLVIGKVTAIFPNLGIILNSVRSPIGMLLGVLLPSVYLIAMEVKRLMHHYGHQRYQLYR